MNLLADVRILVLKRGLEPLRAYRSLVPETSVSTNFTTSALDIKNPFIKKEGFCQGFSCRYFSHGLRKNYTNFADKRTENGFYFVN